MRLIHYGQDGSLTLRSYFHAEVPRYAILSHTWGDDEVLYQDFVGNTAKGRAGFSKLMFCAEQARRNALDYFWVDTCCIDKSSSAELQEAINSMFQWYGNAARCFVYLSDVQASVRQGDISRAFRASRWFTRGWTLQELLAPAAVEFFTSDGIRIGGKMGLTQEIHEITGISVSALQGRHLSEFSVEERFKWAQTRVTTRGEDSAYCLLGIFNIHMPLIYGEGASSAMKRLREEIIRSGRVEGALLDSSTSGEYSYLEPLVDSEFRLLQLEAGDWEDEISISIKKCSLKHPLPYYALSYEWGQQPLLLPIKLHGLTTSVRPNLYYALRRIRRRTRQLSVWVDSLCIDQVNIAERNAQIRKMAEIYHGARSVFIWLGEEDSTSKSTIDHVHEILGGNYNWNSSWWEHYQIAGFAKITERSWFRRGWVIQEAAFAKHATIYCGDRVIQLAAFTKALAMVISQLGEISSSRQQSTTVEPAELMRRFRDSPATKLLVTIQRAFEKSNDGSPWRRKLSLEDLVLAATYTEMTDQRDMIYALLNMANDVSAVSAPQNVAPGYVFMDYRKTILDVYAEFVMHCCNSGSLDIICRPWAPRPTEGKYPSWIACRDRLPFGDPLHQADYRRHGKPLVGSGGPRIYNSHSGSTPRASIRKKPGTDECDGLLRVVGISLGKIDRMSTRMADSIITEECLDILGRLAHDPLAGSVVIPNAVWNTLCAGRDHADNPAPQQYESALLDLLQSAGCGYPNKLTHTKNYPASIDVEELLTTELPSHVREFLEVARGVLWNRRTFRLKENGVTRDPVVGLVPQRAKEGDEVCILYGCSVPVVLRMVSSNAQGEPIWHLVGDAYVYGAMDGEMLDSLLSKGGRVQDVEFVIQ
jgi:hypothetical protein